MEEIARLVGHKGGSTVTERIYRHELRPVIEEGARVMDMVFGANEQGDDERVSKAGGEVRSQALCQAAGSGRLHWSKGDDRVSRCAAGQEVVRWVGDTGFEPVTSSV